MERGLTKLENTPSSSLRSIKYFTHEIKPKEKGGPCVSDRMDKLPGYKHQALTAARVALVGAGAGSVTAWALIRKGIGFLGIYDGDSVELTNLPRQLYYPEQIFSNKALSLAHNLRREAVGDSVIQAFPVMFQVAAKRGDPMDYTLAICLVDNDETRADVARFFYHRQVPVIFAAFNGEAEGGYCFIQQSKPQTPCFGCLYPDAVRNPAGARCGLGASVDVVLITAGLVTWAVDFLFGNRKALWRYKEISLAGYEENDGVRVIPVRPNCPICGRGETDV